jgi:hypothetical protein
VSGSDALAQAGTDPDGFLDRLAQNVRHALPDGTAELEIERERTLGDRLAGRPGRAVGARFPGGGLLLTLRRAGSRWDGEAARVVGGVVIARQPLPLGRWLDALAASVAATAVEAAGDATAASRALTALGLQPADPPFAVDPDAIDRGLGRLVAEAAERLPEDAVALVSRIAALLTETAPRVDGDADGAALVRRTAAVYLPETLRAFAALPTDWARSHTLLDGSTPYDALLTQLRQLEAAATRMRDAAVGNDADALLLNGLFLEQRFGPSGGATA